MPEYFDLPPISPDIEEPGTRGYDIITWGEDRLKRAAKFLKSQIGYDRIDETLNELFSNERKASASSYIPSGANPLSVTRCNLLMDAAESLVAQLTDTRYFWKLGTHNPKYENQSRIFNKQSEAWYKRQEIGLRLGDVIRMYTVAGTGYAHIYYSRRLDDLFVESEDPRMVFPIDPMDNFTLETCLGVIIRRPRTPEWIKEEFDGKIVSPDAGGAGAIGAFFGWLQRTLEGPGERGGGPLTKKTPGDSEIPGTPTAYVNTMFLKDKRENKKGTIVRLGKWDNGNPMNPWSYEVRPGQPLYPYGRIISWSNGVYLHDGPSPYWSGKYPLLKLTLNPWPKTWFGKAPLWDCVPLNRSVNCNLRVVDDHAAQVAQPGVVGDRNVSKAEMNKINTRAAGMKVKTNLASGKGIQIVNPPPLDAVIWEAIKWCEEKIQKLCGTADPTSMTNLGQLPSGDTLDTLFKAMTPKVRLRSRILEAFYTQLAEHWLYLNLEFDTLPKRIAMFGPQGATKEDFDYSPKSMIPDSVPDGEPGDIATLENAMGADNPPNMYERAKFMLASFYTTFDPSSLLNTAAQEELMKYFVLAKMGYISVFTLLDKMGVENFAPPGLKIPPDEISRLQLQQQLGIGMIANAQGRKATDAQPPALGANAEGPTITSS